MENIHPHQTVESYDLTSFTVDANGEIDGADKVQIVVLNDWKVEVKTFGINHEQFSDLEYDVLERLVMAGYNVDRLSFNF